MNEIFINLSLRLSLDNAQFHVRTFMILWNFIKYFLTIIKCNIKINNNNFYLCVNNISKSKLIYLLDLLRVRKQTVTITVREVLLIELLLSNYDFDYNLIHFINSTHAISYASSNVELIGLSSTTIDVVTV